MSSQVPFTPCRGFTTLSGTLGKLAMCLHEGLLQAAATEPDLPVLAAVLRALCMLAAAAPYPRLPPSLLPRMLAVRTQMLSCSI